MTAAPTPQPAPVWRGDPSREMRRFAAGLRVIVAMLCSLMLVGDSRGAGAMLVLLLGYDLWAALLLFSEARGRRTVALLLQFWLDVAWSASLLHVMPSRFDMLVLTFMLPVVIASITLGVRYGVGLGLAAAVGLVLDFDVEGWGLLHWNPERVLPALGVMALVPAAALLSRPLGDLRRRIAVASKIEAEVDPRRGLQALAMAMATRLREESRARVTALVLPAHDGGLAVVASEHEGAFRVGPQVQAQMAQLLQALPPYPHRLDRRRRLLRQPRWVMRCSADAGPAMREVSTAALQAAGALGELLDVSHLVVVPIERFDRRHGHLLLSPAARDATSWDDASLGAMAPDLARMVEQAAVVDELQNEIVAHERARIGRDLHDSAIQPYLGLKYAVEGIALRVPADSPVHDDIQALLGLVNSEVHELRETISVLRTGQPRGDNALVPAVKRQVRRFSVLFGIQVHLDCPEAITASRALAGALFHMVNEALNNVRKHTTARNAWVRLEETPTNIQLTVRDDAGSARGRPVDDFLPQSLSERVEEVGGTLEIHRRDALDTELVICVPH